MFRSIGFPDPTTGEYLKTTAESAEAAEIAEKDLSVYVAHPCIFSAVVFGVLIDAMSRPPHYMRLPCFPDGDGVRPPPF